MTDRINRNPEAIARVFGGELPPLPDWIPDGGPVWHSTIHEYGLACAEAARAPLLVRIKEQGRLLADAAAVIERQRVARKKAEARVVELEARIAKSCDAERSDPEGTACGVGYKLTKAEAEVERLKQQLGMPLETERENERLRGLLAEARGEWIKVGYGASHEDVSEFRDFCGRIDEALKEKP
jgi:hypothetical protein